jgi:hypothetical protein
MHTDIVFFIYIYMYTYVIYMCIYMYILEGKFLRFPLLVGSGVARGAALYRGTSLIKKTLPPRTLQEYPAHEETPTPPGPP